MARLRGGGVDHVRMDFGSGVNGILLALSKVCQCCGDQIVPVFDAIRWEWESLIDDDSTPGTPMIDNKENWRPQGGLKTGYPPDLPANEHAYDGRHSGANEAISNVDKSVS